ncbi:class I SAM-dependent methyltransferase [Kribbella antibiotica]|uniref:Class I SAM-dependent methyltransferase n=1 Tax=Kribbella antibiotica TaxID=190195 RepID=A0A4R4ZLN2_9ACTN|nr:class I SAM-dependent methyltransferase [Kribbella antibiotica]TDD58784.1 class I SAM-dependent methyltransferase [Kribbella antibiotica]
MVERALSFGSVAETYERFRPGYSAELVDVVTEYAGTPIRTALEFGAGTGKATRLFAGAGIAVTATEPDADMLAEMRKHVPANVTTALAAFEDLPLDTSYELVYSAAALHWTKPEGRWERMAALVRPGGVFASFGIPVGLADPELREIARAARAPYLEEDGVPSPDGTPADQPMQWPGTELLQSEWFTDVRQTIIERRLTISAEEYVGHLSTVSAYVMLAPTDRDEVFRRTLEVLPESVELDAQVHVHLARRK